MEFPANFKWKKSEELGSGGQATVFAVKDTTGLSKGTYALKPLKEDATAQAYERFQREVTAIKGLDHPNIIKIIESSKPEDAFHYYVMEYHPDAKPLKRQLNTLHNPFHGNAEKALDLFAQLIGVIDAIKKAKVVHRDLSPANVLILPKTNLIKVIDFGICQIEGETVITLVDEGLGTRNYAAPECEAGAEGEISFKSDMYSAGKILWSAVTNQAAFARENPAFTGKSMRALNLRLPTWHLHHIFERTIRHNPDHRFASPQEAMEVIGRVHNTVMTGGLPLEKVGEICRVCRFGEIKPPPGWPGQVNHPFRSDLRKGLEPVVCVHCGSFDILDRDHLTGELKRRANLL